MVAFAGDTDGSASYTTLDDQLLSTRVRWQPIAGFQAYPQVDPTLVGDVNSNSGCRCQ